VNHSLYNTRPLTVWSADLRRLPYILYFFCEMTPVGVQYHSLYNTRPLTVWSADLRRLPYILYFFCEETSRSEPLLI
jgi:hypothetical protein